jgi:hypothetical protein
MDHGLKTLADRRVGEERTRDREEERDRRKKK